MTPKKQADKENSTLSNPESQIKNEETLINATDQALEKVASTTSPPNPDIENIAKTTDQPVEITPEGGIKKFDPAIHEADIAGQPVMTPTGRFKFKKGVLRSLHVPPSDNAEENRRKMEAAQRRMAAEMIVNSFVSAGIMIFGDEWVPEIQTVIDPLTQKEMGRVDEREILVTTTDQYMAAKGINDIPPGLCLTLVISSYCLKRASKPKTQGKLYAFFGGLRGKIANFFSKVGGIFKKK